MLFLCYIIWGCNNEIHSPLYSYALIEAIGLNKRRFDTLYPWTDMNRKMLFVSSIIMHAISYTPTTDLNS